MSCLDWLTSKTPFTSEIVKIKLKWSSCHCLWYKSSYSCFSPKTGCHGNVPSSLTHWSVLDEFADIINSISEPNYVSILYSQLKLSPVLYDLACFSPNLVAMATSPSPNIIFLNSLTHILLFTVNIYKTLMNVNSVSLSLEIAFEPALKCQNSLKVDTSGYLSSEKQCDPSFSRYVAIHSRHKW